MTDRIFKILRPDEWVALKRDGRFEGSPADRQDGFIHLSTARQLRGTLEKHYAGDARVVLVAVNGGALASELRWEVSRGGDLFPHLYVPLPLADVLAFRDLDARTIGMLSDEALHGCGFTDM